jgi:hypothetical protein
MEGQTPASLREVFCSRGTMSRPRRGYTNTPSRLLRMGPARSQPGQGKVKRGTPGRDRFPCHTWRASAHFFLPALDTKTDTRPDTKPWRFNHRNAWIPWPDLIPCSTVSDQSVGHFGFLFRVIERFDQSGGLSTTDTAPPRFSACHLQPRGSSASGPGLLSRLGFLGGRPRQFSTSYGSQRLTSRTHSPDQHYSVRRPGDRNAARSARP